MAVERATCEASASTIARCLAEDAINPLPSSGRRPSRATRGPSRGRARARRLPASLAAGEMLHPGDYVMFDSTQDLRTAPLVRALAAASLDRRAVLHTFGRNDDAADAGVA